MLPIADAMVPKEQLDAVYRERNLVVALAARLALQYPRSFAWIGRHQPAAGEEWDPAWENIIFIDIAGQQLSWHIHESELPVFQFLPDCRDLPPRSTMRWDGHSTEEKYRRILHLLTAA